jgi:hypothetical protein
LSHLPLWKMMEWKSVGKIKTSHIWNGQFQKCLKPHETTNQQYVSMILLTDLDHLTNLKLGFKTIRCSRAPSGVSTSCSLGHIFMNWCVANQHQTQRALNQDWSWDIAQYANRNENTSVVIWGFNPICETLFVT